jgi:hypothetical protein
VGTNAASTIVGAGGIGYACNITGSTVYYGGGGGGGVNYSGGTYSAAPGGLGGGGTGAIYNGSSWTYGINAVANTGGGAPGTNNQITPGTYFGGSGVVIILCMGV